MDRSDVPGPYPLVFVTLGLSLFFIAGSPVSRHLAAQQNHGVHAPGQSLTSLSAASELPVAAGNSTCAYGTLPGTWVTNAIPGARWRLLLTSCQLDNLLEMYAAAGRGRYASVPVAEDAAQPAGSTSRAGRGDGSISNTIEVSSSTTISNSSSSRTGTNNNSSSTDNSNSTGSNNSSSSAMGSNEGGVATSALADTAGSDADAPAPGDSRAPRRRRQQQVRTALLQPPLQVEGEPAHGAVAPRKMLGPSAWEEEQLALPPPVKLLLLSDSVDRFVLTHLCNHLSGVKSSEAGPRQATAGAGAAAVADAAAAHGDGSGGRAGRRLLEGSSAGGVMAATNLTAYVLHTCLTAAPIKVAASYFPGVHLSGPFHRNLTQNYQARIDAVAAQWAAFAGGEQPDAVVVASLLWDVARLHLHEEAAVAGPELSPAFLASWAVNFTQVVTYARSKFPRARLWLTHTTLPPAHDAASGMMVRSYLGRRYFIAQLNAAAVHAAAQLGLQVVDYAAIGQRWMDSQAYLEDFIHPGKVVGLEVANVYLNLIHQALGLRG